MIRGRWGGEWGPTDFSAAGDDEQMGTTGTPVSGGRIAGYHFTTEANVSVRDQASGALVTVSDEVVIGRAYVRPHTAFPVSSVNLLGVSTSGSGFAGCQVTMLADGTLEVDGDAVNRPDYDPLELDSWYMVEIAIGSRSGVGMRCVRLDGEVIHQQCHLPGPVDVRLEMRAGAATVDSDDLALNDSTGGAHDTWPGPGVVRITRPPDSDGIPGFGSPQNQLGTTIQPPDLPGVVATPPPSSAGAGPVPLDRVPTPDPSNVDDNVFEIAVSNYSLQVLHPVEPPATPPFTQMDAFGTMFEAQTDDDYDLGGGAFTGSDFSMAQPMMIGIGFGDPEPIALWLTDLQSSPGVGDPGYFATPNFGSGMSLLAGVIVQDPANDSEVSVGRRHTTTLGDADEHEWGIMAAGVVYESGYVAQDPLCLPAGFMCLT